MNIELAKSEWWESLTYRQQKEHLENHPRSTKKITKKPSENKRRGRKPSNKIKEPKQLEIKFKFRKDLSKQTKIQSVNTLNNITKTLKKFVKGKDFSIVAAGMVKEFKRYGATEILNKNIESTKDLAAITQIYRDPTMETFRIIYTKKNKIVGHNTVSCRLPGAVSFMGNDLDQIIYDDIKDLGADKYYMVHNHPSGNSSPSEADVKTTQGAVKEVYNKQLDYSLENDLDNEPTEFGGHVVINHKEYSTINEWGDVEHYSTNELKPVYDNLDKAVPHNVLSTFIDSPESLAYVTAQLTVNAQNPNDNLFIISNNQGGVTFVSSIPSELFDKENYDYKRIAPYVRKMLKDIGGTSRFLSIKEIFNEENVEHYYKLLRDDIFTDIADSNGNSLIRYAINNNRVPQRFYQKPINRRDLLSFKGKSNFKRVNK